MDLQQLQELVNIESDRLMLQYNETPDPKLVILARTVKLSEESGELADQILGYCGLQRKDKMYKYSMDKLSKELADVIITTFVLAKACNVDIIKAIDDKMQIVSQRKLNGEVNPIV